MSAARYYTYALMTETLKQWQEQYANLFALEAIGKSRMGRDLWAVTISSPVKEAKRKPAVLVDANIHAGEVAGNAVAMHWMATLLENYGKSPAITWLLDTRTVYVIPRIAVDGAEEYLTTPLRMRSSPHLYPYSEVLPGWILDDIDHNGHILTIRMPADDGAFAVDDKDPRIMRRRRPGEFGGQYYHVFPEGRVLPAEHQGKDLMGGRLNLTVPNAMDFNRNFPIRWAGEDKQKGAGPFPLSEPELYALAQFVIDHPNIAGYAALHTSGGVILRQPSTGPDTVLSLEDRMLFTRVAHEGAQVSGYFAKSNYETFHNGHDDVLMPGAADDWMYDHQGVLSFTVEIWDLPRHAGARGYAEYGVQGLMKLTDSEKEDDMRKIMAFIDEKIGSEAFFAWTPFNHPDLGPVEIGGIDPKFVIQNPPPMFLEEECERVGRFLTTLGLSTPQLAISKLAVEKTGNDIFRIVALVTNQGFLPTSSTQKGRTMKRNQGLTARLDGNYQIIAGQSPQYLGHLSGYGSLDAGEPPASNRVQLEWVIQASPRSTVALTVSTPKAGQVTVPVVLE
ncbi:MAG: peptidase M14 [Sulfobacillus thermosulfidooxidans]|uniref:Peptidase M14 n=1 Tax=Sulfobacillus thermosulfidooxidans TaxID=28034 RepID=A0A2T2WQ63_SULTH|nr:MAG: peptidase M14 [Sulfobacillus thermosulfidooxidans]